MTSATSAAQSYTSGLILGAILGGALSYVALRYLSSDMPKRHIRDDGKHGHMQQNSKADRHSIESALEDEVLAEQLTRNVQFFGRDGQQRVLKSFVVVVGLGGVGSHAAHMLLRAGVGRLRLVDFDQVSLSSLNRHALATHADVGLPKADVLKRHFQDILPEVEVEACVRMYTPEAEEELLGGQPDFVLDAIDDIDTKVALLAACKRRCLPVICACGAGAKADPSRVRITDLSEASLDPLARKVRHQLRVQHDIRSGIQMVLSSEKPRCSLIPISDLGHSPHELQVIPNFRIRTVPVLGTTPAIFGMTAASWILCKLAEQPYIPDPMFLVKGREFETLLHRVQEREELVFSNADGVDLDIQDITFLARDVWRAKSAFKDSADTALEKGLMRHVNNLHFTRWKPELPPTVDNLVLLEAEEAEMHDAIGPDYLRNGQPDLHAEIEATLLMVRKAFGYE